MSYPTPMDVAEGEDRDAELSPSEQLRNICMALAADLDNSPFTREEWNQLDAERLELIAANYAFASENERLRGLLRDIANDPEGGRFRSYIRAALAPTVQPTAARCERCGDSGWIQGDPVAGISDEPCGHDDDYATDNSSVGLVWPKWIGKGQEEAMSDANPVDDLIEALANYGASESADLVRALRADNERLRGLLREAFGVIDPDKFDLMDEYVSLKARIDAALAPTDQSNAARVGGSDLTMAEAVKGSQVGAPIPAALAGEKP